jgi:hypothetical protein
MNKSNCVSVSCSKVRLKIEGITRRSCMRQDLGTDLLLLKMIRFFFFDFKWTRLSKKSLNQHSRFINTISIPSLK